MENVEAGEQQQTEQLLAERRITTVNRWPFVITHPLEKLVNEAAEKQISLGESIKRVWLSQTACHRVSISNAKQVHWLSFISIII